jgi:hypothetical protein
MLLESSVLPPPPHIQDSLGVVGAVAVGVIEGHHAANVLPLSPPRNSLNLQQHLGSCPPDVTYSRFVNGSIFSVPKPHFTAAATANANVAATANKSSVVVVAPAAAAAAEILVRKIAMGAGVSPGDYLVASVYGFAKSLLR